MKLIPVILSGGAGTRLWPVSREGHPKPFMKLVDGETLLEKTYRRAAKILSSIKGNEITELLTVTNRDYYFMSRDELAKTGATSTYLLEPSGRNTAPAISMAAHLVKEKYGVDTIMLVLSADHLIQDEVVFVNAVNEAVSLISEHNDLLVTFGIIPTTPETGYGYIKSGAALVHGYQVDAFVEKPDLQTAQKYLELKNYFWNSGMFCFTADNFLKEIKLNTVEVSEACDRCWQSFKKHSSINDMMLEIPLEEFEQVPDISVDYAVMEKSRSVAVIPSDIGWSDIGSWNAIRDLVKPDENNNRSFGENIFVKSNNTFVHAEDRLVATVGVQNLMIIDTPDALLVANPEYSQDVKQVVNILKKDNHDTFKLHKTVFRPWGTYTVLEEGQGFKMKRIEVKPQGQLSLQMHHHRSEHWVVVKGEAVVVNGERELTIQQNQSTYIPAGHKHRLENRKNEDLVIVEIQCGSYLGEDDIVRFEDNYGRT